MEYKPHPGPPLEGEGKGWGARRAIGILALQGDFHAHGLMLDRLGVSHKEVRTAGDLDGLDGLIIPGGESTTLIKLIQAFGLETPLRAFAESGKGLFGTCAGSILMATHIERSRQFRFGFMDITIRRNGYGRQVDSFEKAIDVPALGHDPLHAVFIRAPKIIECGNGVEVIGRMEETVVAARQGHFLAATFHPELTDDVRLHRYFVEQVLD